MGIGVDSSGRVRLDDTHENLVNTSTSTNPHWRSIEGMRMHFLLRRNRNGVDKGDGTPLIYALKSSRGFRIEEPDRANLYRRTERILAQMPEIQGDYVLPMPSSKSVADDVANLVSERFSVPVMHPSVLAKQTVEGLREQAKLVHSLVNKKGERRALNSQLAAWELMSGDQEASVKDIAISIRHHFTPVYLTEHQCRPIVGLKLILVDDLMSTGSTMRGAAKLLRDQGAICQHGVYLLSGLRK